jgi:hypothetical protein
MTAVFMYGSNNEFSNTRFSMQPINLYFGSYELPYVCSLSSAMFHPDIPKQRKFAVSKYVQVLWQFITYTYSQPRSCEEVSVNLRQFQIQHNTSCIIFGVVSDTS